jgi:hypothetical protein
MAQVWAGRIAVTQHITGLSAMGVDPPLLAGRRVMRFLRWRPCAYLKAVKRALGLGSAKALVRQRPEDHR